MNRPPREFYRPGDTLEVLARTDFEEFDEDEQYQSHHSRPVVDLHSNSYQSSPSNYSGTSGSPLPNNMPLRSYCSNETSTPTHMPVTPLSHVRHGRSRLPNQEESTIDKVYGLLQAQQKLVSEVLTNQEALKVFNPSKYYITYMVCIRLGKLLWKMN